MPFTIGFSKFNQQEKISEHGRLIIDRNNLIFEFLEPNALERRNSANDLFIFENHEDTFDPEYIEFLKKLTFEEDISSPLHEITSHLTTIDKQNFHLHFQFNQNIDLCLVNQMFTVTSPQRWLSIMSTECLDDIKTGIQNYFNELQSDTQLQNNEHLYVESKDKLAAEKRAAIKIQTEKNEISTPQNEPKKLFKFHKTKARLGIFETRRDATEITARNLSRADQATQDLLRNGHVRLIHKQGRS